jgi:hypothetical protein
MRSCFRSAHRRFRKYRRATCSIFGRVAINALCTRSIDLHGFQVATVLARFDIPKVASGPVPALAPEAGVAGRITLSADALRTSGLEITGAGAGLTPEAIGEGTNQVWEWIKAGKLQAEIEVVPLKDVERAWSRADLHGKRIVLVP